MVARSKGLGPEKDCAGEYQQHIQKTDPSSRQRGRPTKTKPKLSNNNKYLVMSPRWGSTPRLTDWLTVSRNVTLTWLGLTLTREGHPQKQDRNCQRVINIHQDLLIDWQSVAMWLWLWQLTKLSYAREAKKRWRYSWELTRVLHWRLWQEDLSAESWRIATVRSRSQGTADEDTAGWEKA
jgi:hypothetical protein